MRKLFKSKILWGAILAATAFSGCGDSEQFVFTNTNGIVNVVPAPPVAVNDSFAALGNATLNQAAANGVLSNDTVNGATISGFDAVGSDGGSITLNQDGSFTYTPALNFVGAETFTYTLTNADGSSTATVTLTSTGLGRFVDNSAADNGTGTQADPFDNLASAAAAAQSGDTIFVARGDGTNDGMTGGFTLPPGVNLVGEGTGLILAQTIVPAGLAPTIQGPITCGGNNIIQGVTIDGSASDLVVIDGVSNVTIQNSTLSNPTDNHVAIDDGSGTLQVLQCTLDTPAGGFLDYIDVNNASTNANISVNGNTFLNAANADVGGLVYIEPTGTSQINATFNNNVANGTVAEQFDYGFYLDNLGTGACTVNVDGNTFNNFSDAGVYPVGAFATMGPLSGSITNNTISNSGYAAIYASVDDNDTLTISGNEINTGGYGIYAYFDGDGTFFVANNDIQNSVNVGIYVETYRADDTAGKIAVRDNTLISNNESFYGFASQTGDTICVDMTGNSFDSNVRFDGNNVANVNVERLEAAQGGPLNAVNTFGVGAEAGVVRPTVNSVAADTCLIP